MDPVTATGLVASIIQVINTTTAVTRYLNDVKDAPKARAELARETANLLALLTNMRYKAEEKKTTDPWFTGIRSLGAEKGPLEQFNRAMEELAKKLKPETGTNFGGRLIWTLHKKECINILSKTERLKTLIGLALQE